MTKLTKQDADALVEIKGLGPSKAKLIIETINKTGDVSIETLAGIRGVSDTLAEKAVSLIKANLTDAPAPTKAKKDTPVTKTKTKTETKAPEAATEAAPAETNGESDMQTARNIRLFARSAADFGFNDLADSLVHVAAPYLDDETMKVTTEVQFFTN